MCYSSPPVYKVRDDLAIFTYQPDLRFSSRSLAKVRVRLLQTLPLTCLSHQVRTDQHFCTMLVWHWSRSWTHITKRSEEHVAAHGGNNQIKSVSNKAQASVHTCHKKIVYVDMLQREESRSLPNNSKSFLYHRPKTSKSKIRSDNFHLQMRNEVCVDNSDIFTSFNVC